MIWNNQKASSFKAVELLEGWYKGWGLSLLPTPSSPKVGVNFFQHPLLPPVQTYSSLSVAHVLILIAATSLIMHS